MWLQLNERNHNIELPLTPRNRLNGTSSLTHLTSPDPVLSQSLRMIKYELAEKHFSNFEKPLQNMNMLVTIKSFFFLICFIYFYFWKSFKNNICWLFLTVLYDLLQYMNIVVEEKLSSTRLFSQVREIFPNPDVNFLNKDHPLEYSICWTRKQVSRVSS